MRMTLDELASKVAKGRDEVIATGIEPDTIYIHPDLCHSLGLQSGDLIHGLEVSCPSWESLGLLGSMAGVDPKGKAMWDPDHVFLVNHKKELRKEIEYLLSASQSEPVLSAGCLPPGTEAECKPGLADAPITKVTEKEDKDGK